MTPEESEIVKIVYSRFLSNEDEAWTKIDDAMEMFSWLSDTDLVNECKIQLIDHSQGAFRCSINHDHAVDCFAPRVLESVEAIISLYDRSGSLHGKNRYILEYYLVLSGMKLIFSEASSAV